MRGPRRRPLSHRERGDQGEGRKKLDQEPLAVLFWLIYSAVLFPALAGTPGDLALIVLRLRRGE